MARNGILGPLSLVFLGGAIVMMLFVILAGIRNTTPLNHTYFLTADTSGISGARPVSQWTYFYVCGSGNVDCSGAAPAPGVGYAWDATHDGAPSEIAGGMGGNTTSRYFWYVWRFGWVFYLIGFAFTVFAFFAGFLACCGRLGAAISGLLSLVGLFFFTIAVALMTDCFVKMRNAFRGAGRSANLGHYAFGFSWGSWAALLIATVLFCLAMRKGKDAAGYGGGRRFGRKRSVRSRRSYDLGSRRVKDDYS